MIEQEHPNWPSSEEVEEELKNYLKDAELGSVRNLALRNFHSEHRASEGITRVMSSLSEARREKSDEQRVQELESDLRIAEMGLALLKWEISKRCDEMKGYEKAYYHISGIFEELGQFIEAELVKNNPTMSEAEREFRINARWDEVLQNTVELLWKVEDNP